MNVIQIKTVSLMFVLLKRTYFSFACLNNLDFHTNDFFQLCIIATYFLILNLHNQEDIKIVYIFLLDTCIISILVYVYVEKRCFKTPRLLTCSFN